MNNGERRGAVHEVAKRFDSLPPHAIEAEIAVLGAVMIDPSVLPDAMEFLSPADFYRPAHGVVFEAMVSIYNSSATALDIVTLNQRLADAGKLDEIGGADFLVTMVDSVPVASNVASYAREVRSKSRLRRLISVTNEAAEACFERPDEIDEIIDNAEREFFEITEDGAERRSRKLDAILDDALESFETNEGKTITGITTGFADLDQMTGGLQRGDLVILAARPSMGKTALALNIATNSALAGSSVHVFSMEMSDAALGARLLSSKAEVEGQKIRRNALDGDDFRRLMAANGELRDLPITIDDSPGLTVMQLRAKARRRALREETDLIVVDYLQLMTSGRKAENRQVEVAAISRGLKAIARELDVPVVCLSQLNRQAANREDRRPRLSDLRESGAIEQDADVVAMIHREDYYHAGDAEWFEKNSSIVGVAEIIIAKQRNGPTGLVNLSWSGETSTFKDHSNAIEPFEEKLPDF